MKSKIQEIQFLGIYSNNNINHTSKTPIRRHTLEYFCSTIFSSENYEKTQKHIEKWIKLSIILKSSKNEIYTRI